MNDIYEEWRSYENDRVLLRPVRAEDAADLLKVYADSKSREMFNCDNFETPCFFGTMEQMEREICFYLDSYRQKAFVRWVVVDKAGGETVGTIELFHRKSEDSYDGAGILRMDIRSDRETEEFLGELLSLVLDHGYGDFHTDRIVTKIPERAGDAARERVRALRKVDFLKAEKELVGEKGERFTGYYERRKQVDYSHLTACGESCVECPKMLDGSCRGCMESDGNCEAWKESGGCQLHFCTRKHGVTFCGLCPEFPCETLKRTLTWNQDSIPRLAWLAKQWNRKRKDNIGGCGFFCGCCPDYRSGNCAGCREAHVQGDCFTLDCINEKKLEYCPECGKFPCDLLLAKKKATVLDQAWMLWKRKTNEGDSGKEEE